MQMGELPAVMSVFTTGSTYDPAAKTVSVFVAVSYAEPTVIRSFTAGLKMEGCNAVRAGNENSYHRWFALWKGLKMETVPCVVSSVEPGGDKMLHYGFKDGRP